MESLTRRNLSEILGKPKRGIIFSDLDGVWFDEGKNFAPPSPEKTDVIKLARQKGFWVVLNSDTAPETLTQFASLLGADTWVIAENGGIVSIPQRDSWYLSQAARLIPELRAAAIENLMTQTAVAHLWQGDATPFIQRGEKLADAVEGQVAFLVNTARICSIGIYTRKVLQGGVLGIDDDLTRLTEATLESALTEKGLKETLVCKRYPNLGSCLVKDPSVTKATAVQLVIDQMGPDLSYWMIGDRVFDSMKPVAGKVRIGAVGNADMDLKVEADENQGVVAPSNKTVADGAEWIIAEILRREAS